MKRGTLILIIGLVLGAAGFASIYLIGTAPCRTLMREPRPELAWLKEEFGLSDAEFDRISRLHMAYLPQCAERCRLIEEQNAKLQSLFLESTNVTPEIRAILHKRAQLRADCEAEMMQHFLEVSRTMSPEQGRRYLAWAESQTFLSGQPMEERHNAGQGGHSAHQHHM